MTSIRDREAYFSYERMLEARKSGEDTRDTREDVEEKAVVSDRAALNSSSASKLLIHPHWREKATLVSGRVMIRPDPEIPGTYAVEFFGSTDNDGQPSEGISGLTFEEALTEVRDALCGPNGAYWRGETNDWVYTGSREHD